MKVSMPTGSMHGWGIAGTQLKLEISKLPPVDGVTLHCITGHDFLPFEPADWNRINIGYCFFEHDILASKFILEASQRWDFIVAGSHWCEQKLRAAGTQNCCTILQGIDHRLFNQRPTRSNNGRFIVFSGGKFEYRKGQDIAIAAMRIFMERHTDVWFSCAWHNQWPLSVKTMQQSGVIDFNWRDAPCDEILLETLRTNGIDLTRVVLHPPMDNRRMPFLYAESDVGLFPNRCEGGNNMVMCEYMACGRPVIATAETGHADVITSDNAFCITDIRPVTAQTAGESSGNWLEASLHDVLEQLEQSYFEKNNRSRKGEQACRDMLRLSWDAAAQQFHAVAVSLAGGCSPQDRQKAADGLFAAGHVELAESEYRSLLASFPLNSALHNRLGTVLDRRQNFREAVGHYWKALALDPRFTIARFNLANTQRRMGDESGALENLCQATEADPSFQEAWKSLAMIHISHGRFADAALCFEKLLEIDPDDCESRCALGTMYLETGRFPEAVVCLDAVLASQPDHMLARETKGTALHELDDLDGAETCFRDVLSIDPLRVSALNNLGTVIRSKADPAGAISLFERALALEPDNGQIRFNRVMARMAMGGLPQAWAEYEYRFSTRDAARLTHTDLPRWNGEVLEGRTLLVQSEQGFGDTFQFTRYLPLLSTYGGPVLFECQDVSTKAALSGLKQVCTVIARGEPLPHVDLQIPLLSLPLLFQTTLETIPAPRGYLKPSLEKVAEWKHKITPQSHEISVGLVWGGRKYSLNANRSLQLSQLASLLHIPGVRFYSLQVGPDTDQLESFKEQVVDLGSGIRDFGDTAAIIANLDLVVTIDSAVAHLAGALGAPVWIMLKYGPDWRWLLERSDSPWYSSARLFRQQSPGDWRHVVENLKKSLEGFVVQKKSKVC